MFITQIADKLLKRCPLICNFPWYETRRKRKKFRKTKPHPTTNEPGSQASYMFEHHTSHYSIMIAQMNDCRIMTTSVFGLERVLQGKKRTDMWSIKPVSLEPFPSDFMSQLLNQWRDTMMLCYRGTCCFVQSSLKWSGFIQTSLPGCLLGYWTLPS